MRKLLTTLIVILLGPIFVVFAVANRHFVTVSFDPIHSSDPALAFSLPLFLLLIVVAILGVLAGGGATWFGQRHWRRAARRHESEARAMKAELTDLRTTMTAARGNPQRLSAPLGNGIPSFAGQDKPRPTL